MKHWFKDQHLKVAAQEQQLSGPLQRRWGNLRDRDVAFAARGLGVPLFETILITSYVKAVSGIAKFQSWQLIVRYGGHGVAHGDPERFKVATGLPSAVGNRRHR